MQKSIFCWLLVILMVISMAPMVGAEETHGQAPTCTDCCQELVYDTIRIDPQDTQTKQPACRGNVHSSVSYYGRDALKATANGDKYVYAYDQIYLAISQNQTDSELRISFDGIGQFYTQQEIVTVVDVYRRDHPEHFWISNQFAMSYYTPGQYVGVILYITLCGTERTNAVAQVEAAADVILAGIRPGMTDYKKELYIHDALAAHITYLDNSNAHDIYGAMVLGAAVCEGYAKAFQYMLRQVGIQSYIATGYGGGRHAWNYVRLADRYYLTDLTWNDQGDEIYHAYFNVTDAMLEEDHTTDTEIYPLPVCNSRDAFYFEGTDQYLDSYDVNAVANLFVNRGMKIHVFVPDDPGTFTTWFKANISAIIRKLGIYKSCSYGWSNLGHEIILRIHVSNTAMVVNGGDVVQYETLQQALDSCSNGAHLRLLKNVQEDITLNKDLYVDLAGHDLTGMIHTNGYQVYGMDNTTNTYSCDAIGYFSCVDEFGNAIVPESFYTTQDMMRYMTMETENGYSFHRFYLGITNISLAPFVTGFGYKAEFYGDEMVQSRIASIGYSLWLTEDVVISRHADFKNSLSLRLKDFDVVNYGETPVHACATITLTDGTIIESATASYSMRQFLEQLNESAAELDQVKLSALLAMIGNNPTMKSWQVENLYKKF